MNIVDAYFDAWVREKVPQGMHCSTIIDLLRDAFLEGVKFVEEETK